MEHKSPGIYQLVSYKPASNKHTYCHLHFNYHIFMRLLHLNEIQICSPKILFAIWLNNWACLVSFTGSGRRIMMLQDNTIFQKSAVPAVTQRCCPVHLGSRPWGLKMPFEKSLFRRDLHCCSQNVQGIWIDLKVDRKYRNHPHVWQGRASSEVFAFLTKEHFILSEYKMV